MLFSPRALYHKNLFEHLVQLLGRSTLVGLVSRRGSCWSVLSLCSGTSPNKCAPDPLPVMGPEQNNQGLFVCVCGCFQVSRATCCASEVVGILTKGQEPHIGVLSLAVRCLAFCSELPQKEVKRISVDIDFMACVPTIAIPCTTTFHFQVTLRGPGMLGVAEKGTQLPISSGPR